MYLIDANIFLELELGQKKSLECQELLNMVKDGKIEAIISDITIDSIVIVMENFKKTWREIAIFLTSLLMYKGLRIHSLNMADKIAAAELMGKYSLDFEDSAVLQILVSRSHLKGLISYDRDFDNIPGIKRLEPSFFVGD